MKEITLRQLLLDLIDCKETNDIKVLDLDGDYHNIDSIDVYDGTIHCDDGWYHYFNAFGKGFNKIYIQD